MNRNRHIPCLEWDALESPLGQFQHRFHLVPRPFQYGRTKSTSQRGTANRQRSTGCPREPIFGPRLDRICGGMDSVCLFPAHVMPYHPSCGHHHLKSTLSQTPPRRLYPPAISTPRPMLMPMPCPRKNPWPTCRPQLSLPPRPCSSPRRSSHRS